MIDRRTLGIDLRWTLSLLGLLLAWDFMVPELAWMAGIGGLDGFPWRHHWLTERLLHDGGRLAALVALALLVVNIARPLATGPDLRERVLGLLATLTGLVGVPALKRLSSTSCPWDLQPFGGDAAWVSHWAWGVLDGGPGHCFPSGHAAAGFAFVGVGWMLRATRPRLARWATSLAVASGLIFGAAQVARGAHFPSHVLWTAWLCWAGCLVVFHTGGRRTRPLPGHFQASTATPGA